MIIEFIKGNKIFKKSKVDYIFGGPMAGWIHFKDEYGIELDFRAGIEYDTFCIYHE